ncbi:hypothetical protein HDU87_001599 [Geranomyces variabilis]|uniref:ArfGap-domain-containing protein n=1 Tax=Geranomyces variabilis TaxID=109894 RepID=A0AAD5XSJ9_9FUNG|nr:hypothetical protein HDU87_001599 [Geranomyces variabilis]
MSSQLTDREKKKRDEQNVKQLQELLTLPENQACADCNERGPRWASTNLGCFLCIRCGGLHRKLGTHISKIKSVTLDSWSPEQIEFMKQWGNKKANEKFLAGGAPPPPSHSDQEMEQYVRNKYEKRNFQTPGGASRQSNETFSRDANAYATQIRTLRGMGFENDQLSIAALKRANGNVGATIELLVSGQQSQSSGQQSQPKARENRPEPVSSASTTQHGGRNPASSTALASLRAMGFTNEEENITVLNATGGNLENAANRLLDAKHRREADQTQATPNYSETGPGFALEPPASASRGQRGAAAARQPQQPDLSAQQNQNKPNDLFGGDLFDLNTPAVAPAPNQQSQGQQRSELDAFIGADATVTQQAPARGVSKDNIMSLFNNAQRGGGFGQQMGGQHMGGGYGGAMMSHQQQQNFGGAPNNFGGAQQFQQFQPQFQQANPQQFGGQPAGGANPFGQGNFQPQQQLQQQQPAYTYMSVQNNPFALGAAQAQPRNVGQGFSSPFGQQQQQQPYGQQQSFGQAQYGQQQAQQANTQRQPQQPDPFADLGPSLKGSQPVVQGQRKQ